MEYRQLGKSGLKVPELCFGAGTFGAANEFFKAWSETTQEEANRIVDICMDAGMNLFDTADIYSDGESEKALGKALAKHKRRDVMISTKATFRFGKGPNDVGSSRYHLIQSAERSLKRLGTDYIDIYHLHAFDATSPVEETLRALDDLVREGKIRYIACSNFSGWHLMKSLSVSERYGSLCWPSGVLLIGGTRLRVGADAAGSRSGCGSAGLVTAGLGTTDGQDPPRNRHSERQSTELEDGD
jgi:aryl-alcohol dehydrogenase-like predicted oxidoreductase